MQVINVQKVLALHSNGGTAFKFNPLPTKTNHRHEMFVKSALRICRNEITKN